MTTTGAATRPVIWDNETGAFRVTGFSEASAVLRGDGWSSDPGLSPPGTLQARDMPPGALLFTDPPEHTRLRRLLPRLLPQNDRTTAAEGWLPPWGWHSSGPAPRWTAYSPTIPKR